MKIGYARISTSEQNLDLQLDALNKHSCEKIFTDKLSGRNDNREGLSNAFANARSGDIICVWRLDRLARSLKHLIDIMINLEQKKIGLISITENIDTQTPGGKLVFHIFGAIAQFETDLIRQRTMAGLEAARSRGKIGGRPSKLNATNSDQFIELTKNENFTKGDIAKLLGISKATVYRRLNREILTK